MSVTAAGGFTAAGLASGIKPSGESDLALVAAEPAEPVAAAAVFTDNLAAAAPVSLSREHLATSAGRIGAVLVNSGCANAATGRAGLEVARHAARLTATALGLAEHSVLVCSTGVIGSELPTEPFEAGVPTLVARRAPTAAAGRDAARAIMTTDTRTKETIVAGDGFVLGGMAKGAAMVSPNMATMLAIITTDAQSSPEELDRALRHAVDVSFNSLSIDGCTSTNDTVVLLASGRGSKPARGALQAALTEACSDLAHQMASDAEGGTKVVRVVVSGAPDVASARRSARAIAESSLVKCSWYGADPNWGRIVSEAGASGAPFDIERVAVAYGGIPVCEKGRAVAYDEGAVRRHLGGREIEVRCDLGLGEASAAILSADLTHGYVDENMGLS